MKAQKQNHFSTCQFCGKNKIIPLSKTCKDYISGDSFSLLACISCRCCFTRFDSTDDKNYYGTEYYNSEAGKFSAIVEKLFHYNHKRNARVFKKKFSADRILEIGCGKGYLLKELKRLGAEVYCLESKEAADWILTNSEINVQSLSDGEQNKWPFDSDYFQLIIYWHVLEHLPDPIENLKQATRCLAPGGTLCISIPNVTSLQARVNLSTWFHLDVPRHLFHFSQSGIISILEQLGYRITRVKAGDRIQNLYGWLQSIANLFTPGSINAFYRLLQGGAPLQSANNQALLIQIFTSWCWIPLGSLGFLIEEICQNYGTITIYAEKQHR